MYESPLNKIYSDIQSQMLKRDEENMMLCVNQAVGYSFDKQELIKALNYDRDQYKKGYSDALIKVFVKLNKYANENYPQGENDDYHALVFNVIQECIEIIQKD